MVKAKTSITYYVVVVMLMMVSITINLLADNMSSNQIDVTFTVLSQIVCMLLIPVVLYFAIIKPKSSLSSFKSDFGFKPFKKGEIPKVIALSFIAIYLNTIFANINYYIVSSTGYLYLGSPSHDYLSNVWWLIADLILTAILPAICEETAHRGLFRLKYKDNPIKYILISSMFFALMHQNIAQVIYTFLTGLLFSSVVAFTGNIKASMIMHFMVNATEVFADYGIQTNNIFFALKQVLFNLMASSILGKIIMVILTLVCLYLFFRLLYSFKGSYRSFSFAKLKRLMIDGSLNFDNSGAMLQSDSEKVLDNTFMYVTIIVGIVVTTITLVWGILR